MKKRRLGGKKREKRVFIEASRKTGINHSEPATHDDIEEIEDKPFLKINTMTEFNENPFAKNTPVIPFSNGTEAMVYSEMNCQNCINYESESTEESEAKCKLAFHLDMGNITGDIPLWVAKEIGCSYDPLYGTVELMKECRHFNDGSRPF